MRWRIAVAIVLLQLQHSTVAAEEDDDEDLDLDDGGVGAESFDLRSPKEIDDIYLKIIRHNVRNKVKMGMMPGDPLHKQAEEEARQIGAFRPNKTKTQMGAALLAGPSRGGIAAIAAGVEPSKLQTCSATAAFDCSISGMRQTKMLVWTHP